MVGALGAGLPAAFDQGIGHVMEEVGDLAGDDVSADGDHAPAAAAKLLAAVRVALLVGG
ncbi:uncharacterized protein YjbJ (UPF0337 family) [Nonomuraea jabiensis]|uniref:Uncharacterized protein YjbJ (UPF0337 family) n=1 Tax=Nonomuraea jabiensis TaxID=882448 RepID=A0A7W9L8E1_9ACTN|nr:hypothetical protein [Nonomuraea jabiensis]MBB5774462.1 uncharacterized protein YjbJ (UPF0337 family) [Nonomuraea jabiensis]